MKKILIVDDARLMRSLIRNALRDGGTYAIVEASNGQEAVEAYKVHRPDVVTMDITMEHQDGVEAAKEILKFDAAARVIMITALGQERLLRECVQAGVKDFIVKPFSKERVCAAVARALSN
jgi:two-component system chemotaxis response regulator CheY